MRAEAPTYTPWEITVAETATEQPYEITEDGVVYVGLKLAHPYSKVHAQRVRALKVTDYKVGETIYVTREWGNAMIEAGYVQVDPLDKQARQEALFLNRRNQPLTAKEMEEKFAATGDDSDEAEDSAETETPNAAPGAPSPDAAVPAKMEVGAPATPASAAKAAPATKGRTV